MQFEIIDVYNIDELSEKAQIEVIYWLDQFPLEYETEEGKMEYEYFSDIWQHDKNYIFDHCEINEYKFLKDGTPIHHLLYDNKVIKN